MTNESGEPGAAGKGWKSSQGYTMTAICLVVGVILGYLFRGSAPSALQAEQAAAQSPRVGSPAAVSRQMPTLDQMKQMADKQAGPLLEKLKIDPNSPALLNQIGILYKATHQFKEAAKYYKRALQVDPKNVAARTDLASCLYYEGDVGGALGQLEQSLRYDPTDLNSLFDLGMIKWQGNKDADGAVTAWQHLLQANPKLAEEKKSEVQRLIAQARRHNRLENDAMQDHKE